MTNEEALNFIAKERMFNSQYGTIEDDKVYEKVMEALEKQIPMKPQIDKQALGRNFIVYECPICKHQLDSKTQHNYCDNCGQAIDWE